MFHRLGFESAYAVTVDPEFPARGQWGCSVFCFDPDGRHVGEEFASRWGAPLVVHVIPAAAPEWIGMFGAGGPGGVDGVFGGPAASQMCAVVDGAAYLVDVDAPAADALIAHRQVRQVVGAHLLLLVSFVDIVAVGPEGIAWRSPRLAMDDLQVTRANIDGIHCTASVHGDPDVALIVNPTTGLVLEGPRLDGPAPNRRHIAATDCGGQMAARASKRAGGSSHDAPRSRGAFDTDS